MPAPSRKTPNRIARVLAMHRAGASAREIGEELGLTHRTIMAWLRDAGLKGNGGQGLRKERVRHEPEGAAAVIASAAQTLAEFASAPPPTDRVGAIAHLALRLGQVSSLAQHFGALAKSGTSTMGDFEKAIKLEQNLATQIAELSPPESPDRENDPTNVEAAAAVRQEIAALVEAAERGFLCASCGKNPYSRETG